MPDRGEAVRRARQQGGGEAGSPAAVLRGLLTIITAQRVRPGYMRTFGTDIGTGEAIAGFDTAALWPALQEQVDQNVLYLGAALQLKDDMEQIGGLQVVETRYNRYRACYAALLYVARPARRAMGLQITLDRNPDSNTFSSCNAYGLLMNKIPYDDGVRDVVPQAARYQLAKIQQQTANQAAIPERLPTEAAHLLGIVAAATATMTTIVQQHNGGVA